MSGITFLGWAGATLDTDLLIGQGGFPTLLHFLAGVVGVGG